MHPFILYRSRSRQPSATGPQRVSLADSRQPTADRRRSRRRNAFTLVELLMVIIIIGMLMGLLVVAIGKAMIAGKDAAIVAEIAQLDAAMKKYQSENGILPPAVHNDNTAANIARVRAFWRRVWPRWDNSGTTPVDLTPAEVLVFYLGGQYSTAGSSKLIGFNMNPANPTQAGGQRTVPLFQFQQGRLFDEDGNGYAEYYPPHKRSAGDGVPPYTYFDSASYGTFSTSPFYGSVAQGYAVPYNDGNSPSGTGFMNATTFQILCAGQDNNYGNDSAKLFPNGTGYDDGDNDNLANFSTNRLEDSKP